MTRACLPHRDQRGATLIVALIFLALLSLFAVTAFNSSTTNVRVVGNMQVRQDAIAVAQAGIDAVLSDAEFLIVRGARLVNVDHDNNPDTPAITARIDVPICYRAKPFTVPNNPTADENRCTDSEEYSPEKPYASKCVTTEWQITARVSDPTSGAEVIVNQGAGVLMLSEDAAPCR